MDSKSFLEVDTSIYPIGAILLAAQVFLPDSFVKIERSNKSGFVVLYVKNLTEKKKDLFFNDLLHSTLRLKISEQSKQIRDRIVVQALSSILAKKQLKKNKNVFSDNEVSDVDIQQEVEKLIEEAEKGSYKTDPLDISVPWELSDNAKNAVLSSEQKKENKEK